MSDDATRAQSAEIIGLFTKLIRRLYRLELSDPAMELPIAQMRFCGALLEKPRSMTCLSKELGISLSATTQLADRLEKVGLVERSTEPDDRRVKRLRLTSRGEQIMRARRKLRVERLDKVLSNMAQEDRELIIPAFQKLYEASLTVEEQPARDSLSVADKLLDYMVGNK